MIKKYFVFAICFLLHLSFSLASSDASEEPVNDWFLFIGRLHPLVVHLPIGFLLIAYLMELSALFVKRFKELSKATSFILFFGGISAAFAALIGYFLSLSGGYDYATLNLHKWLGIAVGVVAFICLFIKEKFKTGIISKTYLPLFTVCIIMLSVAGHMGGNLTHGEDYLIKYMPNSIRKLVGIEPKVVKEKKVITDIHEALAYEDVIQPFLEEKCYSCHNSSKIKGGLRLDVPDLIQKGGDSGPSVVAGNPDQSELFKRVVLPEEDEHHMPPAGKRPLTSEEIELMQWWITQGNPFEGTIASVEVDSRIKGLLERRLLTKKPSVFSQKVEVADQTVSNQLFEKYNIIISSIEQNSNLLQVHFLNATIDTLEQFDLKELLPLKDQITWLDLSNTKGKIKPESFKELANFKNLSRLNLQYSEFPEEDISYFKNMEWLEYINLYGVGISDSLNLDSVKVENIYL